MFQPMFGAKVTPLSAVRGAVAAKKIDIFGAKVTPLSVVGGAVTTKKSSFSSSSVFVPDDFDDKRYY